MDIDTCHILLVDHGSMMSMQHTVNVTIYIYIVNATTHSECDHGVIFMPLMLSLQPKSPTSVQNKLLNNVHENCEVTTGIKGVDSAASWQRFLIEEPQVKTLRFWKPKII